MRWRWLLGNFVDPKYGLDTKRANRISSRAYDAQFPRGRFLAAIALALLPVLIASRFLLPALYRMLSLNGQGGWSALTIVLFSWVWGAFVFGLVSRKPIFRAMREYGVRVCGECGYLLDGHAPDDRCPECGGEQTQPIGSRE